MLAIFGLGNVGSQYENTFHNMGFRVIDAFAKKHGLTFSKNKCSAQFCEGHLKDQKVLLFKPTTFMNLSGESVMQAMNFYHLAPKDIMVIFDDVDIPIGETKIREKGSAGTHNGLKSIVASIGSEQFARIKIGIGAPYYNLVDHVLSPVSKEQESDIDRSVEKAVAMLEKWIETDGDVNRVQL